MNAVDTNVLIYAQDPRDPHKRRKAIQLLNNLTDGVLLWQVACEYLAASRKLAPFGFSAADAWADLHELRRSWKASLPTWSVQDNKREIMRRFGTSLWDALLVAACVEAGVTCLYSEDFGNLSSLGGVEIVNPFTGEP